MVATESDYVDPDINALFEVIGDFIDLSEVDTGEVPALLKRWMLRYVKIKRAAINRTERIRKLNRRLNGRKRDLRLKGEELKQARQELIAESEENSKLVKDHRSQMMFFAQALNHVRNDIGMDHSINPTKGSVDRFVQIYDAYVERFNRSGRPEVANESLSYRQVLLTARQHLNANGVEIPFPDDTGPLPEHYGKTLVEAIGLLCRKSHIEWSQERDNRESESPLTIKQQQELVEWADHCQKWLMCLRSKLGDVYQSVLDAENISDIHEKDKESHIERIRRMIGPIPVKSDDDDS